MVRFSCFNAHIGCQKPKKTVQLSVEAMHKTLEDFPQVLAPKDSNKATHMDSLLLEAETIVDIHYNAKPVTDSLSVYHNRKSEETKDKIDLDTYSRVLQNRHYLKKNQSLGSRLCLEGRVPGQNDTDGETDQGFSSESQNHGSKHTLVSQNASCSESVQVSSYNVNNEPVFSIGDPEHSERDGHDNSDLPLSGEGANGSGDCLPNNAHVIAKSCSMPNIVASELTSGAHSTFKYLTRHPRSSEDLGVHVFDMRRKEISVYEVDTEVMREEEKDDGIHKNQKTNFESSYYERFDSFSYSASAKDWIVPVSDELNSVKILQEELPVQNWNELTGKDFKIKRIEEWVNDLQHCSPLEETIELSHSSDHVKAEPAVSNGLTASKADVKVTPGMEAAKRHISSLSASATTAQLANHGLVIIPFLSAFVSLKVLNLSGNAIARITAGALPPGLHMLDLSKNSISTIEGLRELTRLRVLDLSYNRIFRIGHGLASCSSLKELYLAGNKISEVEGLHRLLKLTVLDLRVNKISTTKCLSQLAANYNSLQAISLEGNPAEKNIGDEHLKKHLLGLLPHLVYFNRQAIKVSTLKDAAERSVRLGINSHQFDRGLRSENKAIRKSNYVTSVHRPSSTSIHSRKSQATVSPRQSRGRYGRLPPSGIKATSNHRNHDLELGSKFLNFKSERSIRRTRSEGTLAPP